MDLNLENKNVLVTGSTAGIGREIAKHFAIEGSTVIINGKSDEAAEKTLSELKVINKNVFAAVGDIATGKGIKNIIKTASSLGGIDILVNNAGIYFNHENWFGASTDDWTKLYAVNVIAPVALIQAFVPGMTAKKWGRVIQISSGEATQPFAFMPDYAATKAAMNNLTVSLSRALSKTGITVNSVSPGLIATEGVKDFYLGFAKKNNWESAWEEIERKIMQTILDNNTNALGTPADVASLVCFIASPNAGYINGANIRIDGGSTTSVN